MEKMRIAFLSAQKIGHFCSKSQISGKMDDAKKAQEPIFGIAVAVARGLRL